MRGVKLGSEMVRGWAMTRVRLRVAGAVSEEEDAV